MKHKKKHLVSISRPWRTEAWLSKMAEKGYLLHAIHENTYIFKELEPINMEYRIVYNKDNEFSESIERYKEMGWEVAARGKKILVLMAKTYHFPSENYFGEQEKQAWKRYSLKKRMLGICVAMLFYYISLRNVFSLNTRNIINWNSLNASWLSYIIIIILLLITGNLFFIGQNDRRYIKRIEKMGREAHHGKGGRPVKIVTVLWIALIIVSTMGDFCTNVDEGAKQISNTKLGVTPLIQEEQFSKLIDVPNVEVDMPTIEKLLFTEKYVQDLGVNQTRIQTWEALDGMEHREEEEFTDWVIHQEYHKIKRDINKEAFMDSLIYDPEMMWEYPGWKKEREQIVTVDGLDHVVCVRENEENYVLAAAKGEHILYVEVSCKIEEQQMLAMMKENLNRLENA